MPANDLHETSPSRSDGNERRSPATIQRHSSPSRCRSCRKDSLQMSAADDSRSPTDGSTKTGVPPSAATNSPIRSGCGLNLSRLPSHCPGTHVENPSGRDASRWLSQTCPQTGRRYLQVCRHVEHDNSAFPRQRPHEHGSWSSRSVRAGRARGRGESFDGLPICAPGLPVHDVRHMGRATPSGSALTVTSTHRQPNWDGGIIR